MYPNGQSPQTPGGLPPQQPGQMGPYPPAPGAPYPGQTPGQQYSPQQPWGQPLPAQPQQPYTNPAADPHAIPPQQQQQYAIDYLDQIAPPPSGPKLFSGSFTWIVIGLAILFIFAVSIIALNSGTSNTVSAQTAYLRFDNLSKVTTKYHKYLKSSKLSSTDSNFTLFMTNAERDLVDPMAKNGTDVKKIDKTLAAKEKSYSADVTAKLEDARLNAILDRVYAREMAYQAQQLIDLYKKMVLNKSKSISDNAKNAIPNLEPIQKAFADFNDTTSASS